MDEKGDFFTALEEMSRNKQSGFFQTLDLIIKYEKQIRKEKARMSFFSQLDEMVENEQRLAEINSKSKRTFLDVIEEIVRQEQVLKILRRLAIVRSFNAFKYYPEDIDKTKRKHKQRSMLIGTLAQMYNFIAFGFKDPLVPIPRKKMESFNAIWAYYVKYTGIEPGPRYRLMKRKQAHTREVLEAIKAQKDAKKAMLGEQRTERETATGPIS